MLMRSILLSLLLQYCDHHTVHIRLEFLNDRHLLSTLQMLIVLPREFGGSVVWHGGRGYFVDRVYVGVNMFESFRLISWHLIREEAPTRFT